MTVADAPNPGSPAAWDLGCVCPITDNAHGQRPAGWKWWVIRLDCPVHGSDDEDGITSS